jgi:iron complex outermembrane receptor protein
MTTARLPLALAIAALPFASHAQDARLPDVVVSATKADDPSATRRDAAALAPLVPATSDAASLLSDVPGVSLYGAGGVSSLPVIHGMADDRLRTKVDGMDLVASCPNHMNPPLSYVDPSNVGKLDVYAGITPVSVGGDSIGGTIVAETPEPEFAAPGQDHLAKGEAGVFYRSNGDAHGGHLSATWANDSVSVTYSGATAEANDYKAADDFKTTTATGRAGHTLALDEVGSTAYETRNHTLGLAFRNGDHLFEAKLGYQDIPYELYPNQRMDMLSNEQHRLNLRYLGKFGWGSLEARAYHETVRHHMDFGDDKRMWYGTASGGSTSAYGLPCSPISSACAYGMPMDTDGRTTGASVKASIDLTAQDLLRVGSEYQHYTLDDWWPPSGAGMWPGTFWNIQDGKRDRTAVYAEWESHPAAQWTTLAGLRFERVDTDAGDVYGYFTNNTYPTGVTGGTGSQNRDAYNFNTADHARTDNNWDLTALARYRIDETRDVEFGFARKVRSPNLYERYTWSTWTMAGVMNNFVGDGNGYVGNVDLKPEVAHTVSATFDWHAAGKEWQFKATPYYTRVTDFIDAVQWNATTNLPATALTTDKFVLLKYENQSARLYGIDLSGRMPLARTGVGTFGLKGLLSYVRGTNRTTGDDLYNIMPLNARLTLTHAIGGWDNALEWVLVDAKDKVSDQRNEIPTAGYGLLNLRASYAWRQARVDFGVDNLFDKFYYQPLGGAYTGQGTTMSINAIPWGIAVPGPSRSLYAGVTVKF